MRPVATLLLVLVLPASAMLIAQSSKTTFVSAVDSTVPVIDAMKDHSRPLLVFYRRPEPGRKEAYALLTMQLSMVEGHGEELKNRDVPVILLPTRPGDAVPVSASDEAKLRRRFAVGEDDFVVVLIGKDGEEKLRSRSPVTMERLMTLIDSMPMRQQEVRDGHAK